MTLNDEDEIDDTRAICDGQNKHRKDKMPM